MTSGEAKGQSETPFLLLPSRLMPQERGLPCFRARSHAGTFSLDSRCGRSQNADCSKRRRRLRMKARLSALSGVVSRGTTTCLSTAFTTRTARSLFAVKGQPGRRGAGE